MKRIGVFWLFLFIGTSLIPLFSSPVRAQDGLQKLIKQQQGRPSQGWGQQSAILGVTLTVVSMVLLMMVLMALNAQKKKFPPAKSAGG